MEAVGGTRRLMVGRRRTRERAGRQDEEKVLTDEGQGEDGRRSWLRPALENRDLDGYEYMSEIRTEVLERIPQARRGQNSRLWRGGQHLLQGFDGHFGGGKPGVDAKKTPGNPCTVAANAGAPNYVRWVESSATGLERGRQEEGTAGREGGERVACSILKRRGRKNEQVPELHHAAGVFART
ncbi:hypothetical protein DFH09DRAFT_1102884 [Mycena vulgaris]|nr:hypothetical protein DFH09DRAFT_1102884 [Mycena vulgaris]